MATNLQGEAYEDQVLVDLMQASTIGWLDRLQVLQIYARINLLVVSPDDHRPGPAPPHAPGLFLFLKSRYRDDYIWRDVEVERRRNCNSYKLPGGVEVNYTEASVRVNDAMVFRRRTHHARAHNQVVVVHNGNLALVHYRLIHEPLAVPLPVAVPLPLEEDSESDDDAEDQDQSDDEADDEEDSASESDDDAEDEEDSSSREEDSASESDHDAEDEDPDQDPAEDQDQSDDDEEDDYKADPDYVPTTRGDMLHEDPDFVQPERLIFERAPPNIRKIVLAINMAEASITINDVVFVGDCGKAKETTYDALNNTPHLLPSWISLSNKLSHNQSLVRAVICSGLFPGIASVVQRETSMSFKTTDGQVSVYSNSVNSRLSTIPYPWLVFGEKVKVNVVLLRDSTGVPDSSLILYGGALSSGVQLGMVTTDLLMSGATTKQAKFFINVLAEPAEVVAEYLVPNIRAIPTSGSMKPTYIRFLTSLCQNILS